MYVHMVPLTHILKHLFSLIKDFPGYLLHTSDSPSHSLGGHSCGHCKHSHFLKAAKDVEPGGEASTFLHRHNQLHPEFLPFCPQISGAVIPHQRNLVSQQMEACFSKLPLVKLQGSILHGMRYPN